MTLKQKAEALAVANALAAVKAAALAKAQADAAAAEQAAAAAIAALTTLAPTAAGEPLDEVLADGHGIAVLGRNVVHLQLAGQPYTIALDSILYDPADLAALASVERTLDTLEPQ